MQRLACRGRRRRDRSRSDLRPGSDRADLRALTVRKKTDLRTVIRHRVLETMTKSPLKLVPPAIVKRTVTAPVRKPNADYRIREHLTGAEVDRLIDAAKANRWGHRDSTMILVAFRHGLMQPNRAGGRPWTLVGRGYVDWLAARQGVGRSLVLRRPAPLSESNRDNIQITPPLSR